MYVVQFMFSTDTARVLALNELYTFYPSLEMQRESNSSTYVDASALRSQKVKVMFKKDNEHHSCVLFAAIIKITCSLIVYAHIRS